MVNRPNKSSMMYSALLVICFLPFLMSSPSYSAPPTIIEHYFVIRQFDKVWTTKNIEVYEDIPKVRFIELRNEDSQLIKRNIKKQVTLYGAFSIEEIEAKATQP